MIPSSFDGIGIERASMLSLSPAYAIGPGVASDTYGSQLAIGDFNGDDKNDLAISVPGHDSPANNSGAVQVVYQSDILFADGFDD